MNLITAIIRSAPTYVIAPGYLAVVELDQLLKAAKIRRRKFKNYADACAALKAITPGARSYLRKRGYSTAAINDRLPRIVAVIQ